MFRFSRKRLFPAVSFEEFKRIATKVSEMASQGRSLEVKVLTFEPEAYGRNTNFVFFEKKLSELQQSYTLEQFTAEIWKKSTGVQLTIKERSPDSTFMIIVAWSKIQSASVYFYGQVTGTDLANRICNVFARGNLLTFIGDGYDADGPVMSSEPDQAAAA